MKDYQLPDRDVFRKAGSEIVLDIEVYPNYFLICFKYVECGSRVYFEGMDVNKRKLLWILSNNTIFTFNGNAFDMVILYYFLAGDRTERDMFLATHRLIVENVYWVQFLFEHKIAWGEYKFDHVDLIEPSFGQASLKLYAGRLHADKMQDLPYPPDMTLNNTQKAEVLHYCWNDCDNTIILKNHLQKQLDLRVAMGINYSADLRSKSDAQIAEVVIARELRWKYGVDAKRNKLDPDYSFKYNIPENVNFRTENMQNVLEVIRNANFTLNESGSVKMPEEIRKLRILIGDNKDTRYQMGIGGLHSTEKWMHYEHDEDYIILDRDVESYYPRIIINQKLYPKHLTNNFLDIYESIVTRRLEAKATGDKLNSDTLKIVINGSFGKFGSAYSILYSPNLLIQTTISGQLYLMMLIERFEMAGFKVISANTDGVVCRFKKERYDEFNGIVDEWERDTQFITEETRYNAYFARDVNNYIAVKQDGTAKTKGCFGESGIAKNPAGSIIYRAVSEYITRGVPVRDTVSSCADIREFVFVRTVKGGAVDAEGISIGKVVRYYKRKGEFGTIRYEKNGNKVPNSDGCTPFMDLSVAFPPDIEYRYYFSEAEKILACWFKKPPKQLTLF